MNKNEFLWVQKYRPSKIDDCILPESLKNTFKEFVAQGRLPNFIFAGTAGLGKTTLALALCNEVGASTMFLNGSEESGIDVLRSKIKTFASGISLTGAKKVIIIDEGDYLNSQSTQPALRGVMEEFSSNCSFIITCNYKNKIIEPLHSRCSVIDFKIEPKDKKVIAAQFLKRTFFILDTEGIKYDKKVVAALIMKHFPDFRRVLNELQRYSSSGVIDEGILVNIGDEVYNEMFKLLKEKNFTGVRKWVGTNSDIESTDIFRKLYDKSADIMSKESIPQLVLILADYQYKAAFVMDHELNTMACLTEVMGTCKFNE